MKKQDRMANKKRKLQALSTLVKSNEIDRNESKQPDKDEDRSSAEKDPVSCLALHH